MEGKQKRLTAKKALVEDLIGGDYFTQEGFKSNYLITPRGQRVSRAKIMGTVVTKFINDDESYAFIVVDDGTETIRGKFFQDMSKFKKIDEGDLVTVIGKVREYEGEIYLNPEIVKEVEDPNYLTLHLAEVASELKKLHEGKKILEKLKEEHPDNYGEVLADEIGEERARSLLMKESADTGKIEETEEGKERNGEFKKKIIKIIEKLDEGQGASYQDIIEEVEEDEKKIDEVINDLLTEGTCFEPRPGRIKKL